MCLSVSRHFFDRGSNGAQRAAAFTTAAVIASLEMADWQISDDVTEATVSAVDTLAGACVRVTVAVHTDGVDIEATDGVSIRHRRCLPRRPFRTAIACDRGAPPVAGRVPADPATYVTAAT